MLAPRQSCTDFIPASRSRQTVSCSGSVFSSVVLPMPGGPKIASEVLFVCRRQAFVGADDAKGHADSVMAVG